MSLHSRQEMDTVGMLSPDSLWHLPFFSVSVKMLFRNFTVKNICEGNSDSVCQAHRDAKWSGKHCQWLGTDSERERGEK